MNKIVSLTGITFISILLFCCKSSQEISQTNPPFKVTEATYNERIENDGKNVTMVSIKIDNTEIKLDSVYFRNRSTRLEFIKKNSEEKYVGYFKSTNTKKDLILHSDPKKEFGNQVPDISQRIPFKLEKDQAVVSYIYKGKISYYKILKISEPKF